MCICALVCHFGHACVFGGGVKGHCVGGGSGGQGLCEGSSGMLF